MSKERILQAYKDLEATKLYYYRSLNTYSTRIDGTPSQRISDSNRSMDIRILTPITMTHISRELDTATQQWRDAVQGRLNITEQAFAQLVAALPDPSMPNSAKKRLEAVVSKYSELKLPIIKNILEEINAALNA